VVNSIQIADEIRHWIGKPKELVAFITKKVVEDEKIFPQLIKILNSGSDVEKGTVADCMKHISAEKPEIVAPYIDLLINYVNFKVPRVKWGIQESVGNIAKKYPLEAEKAVPNLLLNTQDKSTVVRWCAAYALTEIVKYNIEARKNLIPKLEKIANSERNNGVKNVYLKAWKVIGFREKLKT